LKLIYISFFGLCGRNFGELGTGWPDSSSSLASSSSALPAMVVVVSSITTGSDPWQRNSQSTIRNILEMTGSINKADEEKQSFYTWINYLYRRQSKMSSSEKIALP
jgi:hypothetical protein